MDIETCYKTLGLEPGSPLFFVRKAYNEIVKIWQPLLDSDDPEEKAAARKKLTKVESAFKAIILSDLSSEKIGGGVEYGERTPVTPRFKPQYANRKYIPKGKSKKRVERDEQKASQSSTLTVLICMFLVVGSIVTAAIFFGPGLYRNFLNKTEETEQPIIQSPAPITLEALEMKEMEKMKTGLEQYETRRIFQEQKVVAEIIDERLRKENVLKETKRKTLITQKTREQNDLLERKKQDELARLKNRNRKMAQERKRIKSLLKKSRGRFVERGESVVIDLQTGLMWSMLPSDIVVGKCLNYKSALTYVKNLRTGGYSDWRLPDSKELSEILIRKPVYPYLGKNWFWTSQVFTRGWKQVAAIVRPGSDEVIGEDFAYLEKCGAVQAVRP